MMTGTSLETDRSGPVGVLRTELHGGDGVRTSGDREEPTLGVESWHDGRHEITRPAHGTPTGNDETGRRRLGVSARHMFPLYVCGNGVQ